MKSKRFQSIKTQPASRKDAFRIVELDEIRMLLNPNCRSFTPFTMGMTTQRYCITLRGIFYKP